jgi:hypothetical protein
MAEPKYRCPYCAKTFADAIARSQHVRDCPDRADGRKR